MSSKQSNATVAAPKISPVTIALQLVSGERLIAEFRPEGDGSFVNLFMFWLILYI